jgi:hypothetical protein
MGISRSLWRIKEVAPERELYYLHTDREELNIEVMDRAHRKLTDAREKYASLINCH